MNIPWCLLGEAEYACTTNIQQCSIPKGEQTLATWSSPSSPSGRPPSSRSPLPSRCRHPDRSCLSCRHLAHQHVPACSSDSIPDPGPHLLIEQPCSQIELCLTESKVPPVGWVAGRLYSSW